MKNTELLQLSECACLNLRKTTRRVTQAFDGALRPSGLRATQFSMLAFLKGHTPLPITALAEAMDMDRTTLSRNLGPLRGKGLLTLRPGKDARVQEVSITEAGKRRLEEALPLWRDIQQRMLDLMGSDALTRLLGDLAGARKAISGQRFSAGG